MALKAGDTLIADLKAGDTFVAKDGTEMIVIPRKHYRDLALGDAIHGGRFGGVKIRSVKKVK